MPNFQTIPKFKSWGNYVCDIGFSYLEEQLEDFSKGYDLDLDPDFQRGHVWTEEQQIAFVEFMLKGGKSGRDILFNCSGWNSNKIGQLVLVDGKQRIEAMRKFLRDELAVFGGYTYSKFEGKIRAISQSRFRFHVNDLPTRKEVLQWYLEINTGGTPHTEEEIEKVKKLLEKEK